MQFGELQFCLAISVAYDLSCVVPHQYYAVEFMERIPNGHSFNVFHMEGIAGELKRPSITQSETK